MHNPLRSEAEAFRWVVVIAAGAATVMVVTWLTRPLIGAIWGLILIGAGIVYLIRSSRGADLQKVTITRGGDGRYRVLLMANQTVRSPDLVEAAVKATEGHTRHEIMLVVPTLVHSRAALWASETDEATERARQRMELTLLDLKQAGRNARGKVGDTAPSQALADSLGDFPADEIIISTLPRESSHWLEQGVVERARIEIDLPIQHLIWDPKGDVVDQGLKTGDA